MPRMFFYGCCPPAPVGPAGPPPPPPPGDCVGAVVGTSPATVTLGLIIDGVDQGPISLAAANGYGISSFGTTFELGCTGGSWAFFWVDSGGLRGTCLLPGTTSGTNPIGGAGSGTSTDGQHTFSVSVSA